MAVISQVFESGVGSITVTVAYFGSIRSRAKESESDKLVDSMCVIVAKIYDGIACGINNGL